MYYDVDRIGVLNFDRFSFRAAIWAAKPVLGRLSSSKAWYIKAEFSAGVLLVFGLKSLVPHTVSKPSPKRKLRTGDCD